MRCTMILLMVLASQAESSPKAKSNPRVDHYGDPLPPRAVCRMGTLRLMHRDYVTAAAFSPDGRRFASIAIDGTLKVWEWPSGKELFTSSFYSARPRGLCFSADHRYLECFSGESVAVWDAASGKLILHNSATGTTAFSSDGKRLAWLKDAHSIRFRDLAARADLPAVSRRADVRALAYDAEGRLLIAEDDGERLSLRRLGAEKALYTFDSLEEPILWVEFTSDASRFALQTRKSGVIVIDPRTGKQLGRIANLPSGYFANTLSADGKQLLLSVRNERKSQVWNLEEGKKVCTLDVRAADGGNRVGSFSPDGKLVAMGGTNHPHAASFWDTTTGREVKQFPGHQSGITGLAFSPDGKRLATCSFLRGDPLVRLWDCGTGRLFHSFEAHPFGVFKVAFTPDGTRLVTSGTGRENVGVWDAHTAQRLLALRAHRFYGGNLAVSSDGERFASVGTGTAPDDVVVWDVKTGKRLYEHPTLGQSTQSIHFTPDGRSLIVCNHSGIRIWDIGGEVREFAEGVVCRMALSPDGRLIALTEQGKKVTRLVEVLTGQEAGRFAAGVKGTSIAYSADGRTIALGAEDGKIRFFDAATLRSVLDFRAHQWGVFHLTFSPDGKRLASVGGEGEAPIALLWDAADTMSRPLKRVKTEPKDIEKWCEALSNPEAAPAHRAVWNLVAAPQAALARLKPLLTAEAAPLRGDIKQWIADLDSDDFRTREKAQKSLIQVGDRIAGRLEAAWKTSRSVEQKRRLRTILEAIGGWPVSSQRLLASRGIMVLEQIGDPEARDLLRKLAKGDPGSFVAQEARLSLKRQPVLSELKERAAP